MIATFPVKSIYRNFLFSRRALRNENSGEALNKGIIFNEIQTRRKTSVDKAELSK